MNRLPRSLFCWRHCAHFTLIQSHLPYLYGARFRIDTIASRSRQDHIRSEFLFLKIFHVRTSGGAWWPHVKGARLSDIETHRFPSRIAVRVSVGFPTRYR